MASLNFLMCRDEKRQTGEMRTRWLKKKRRACKVRNKREKILENCNLENSIKVQSFV